MRFMRLSQKQRTIIKTEILKRDEDAEIYLFGSRVDDEAKGGGIDLLVISTKIDFGVKLKILAQLMIKLGEKKIDLLLENDKNKVFTQIAINEGIRL